jgi:type I restriction enzyme S subunit
LEGYVLSDDLIRLLAWNETDTGFLYAFLRTTTGRILINTNKYGAVVQHIEPDHLKDIELPNPDDSIKKQCNDFIMASYALRDQSNELIVQAQAILVEELHLPPLDQLLPSNSDQRDLITAFQVKLSHWDGRIDASYHVPLIEAILHHIGKYAREVTTLGDKRISQQVILPGRFKRIYVEEGQGVAFIGGKQLNELDPANKKYLSLTHHNQRIKDQLTLIENVIMITRSGTIGKINIAAKHWAGWTANEHIIRVVPLDNQIAGYIYAWLFSDYGYQLIKRFTYGSVVDEIDDNHVSSVQIPLLKDEEIQRKINDLVLDANQKRYEAYVLEQKALHVVNEQVLNLQ